MSSTFWLALLHIDGLESKQIGDQNDPYEAQLQRKLTRFRSNLEESKFVFLR